MDIRNHQLSYKALPGLSAAFDPQIYDCPYHEQIGEILMNWVDTNARIQAKDRTGEYEGGARMTKFYSGNERDLKAHDILIDWIESLMVEAANEFSIWTNSAYNGSPEESKRFKLADYWGMMYDEGGGTVLHNHWPYALSFGYYLNTPEGSSPLIVEGQEIQVTEGRLILWPGHMSHEVPDSDVAGRCMIAGNISYAGVVKW